MLPSTTTPASDAQLARSLAKLWPHRLHESSWLKNFFCWMRLHRWAQLDLRDQAQGEGSLVLPLVREDQNRRHPLWRPSCAEVNPEYL
jgi:hypothetical protein